MELQTVEYVSIEFSSTNGSWSLVTCNNMNGNVGHYTKWIESGRQKQPLHGLTHM